MFRSRRVESRVPEKIPEVKSRVNELFIRNSRMGHSPSSYSRLEVTTRREWVDGEDDVTYAGLRKKDRVGGSKDLSGPPLQVAKHPMSS